jgi:predicted SAM-dependent methyltransferase
MKSIFKRLITAVLQKMGYEIRKRPTGAVSLHIGSGLLRFRDMTEILEKRINYHQDRIAFSRLYSLEKDDRGIAFRFKRDDLNLKTLSALINKYELLVRNDQNPQRRSIDQGYDKIHYGCGDNIIEGWLNVDLFSDLDKPASYLRVDLLDRQPFNDGCFRFAFSEDVLEHFDQGDSLIFLSEAYRTLRPDGILRLSFPGLEGVLKKHYYPWNDAIAYTGKIDAYSFWDHRHFYSFEEIKLVAAAIGFRKVTRVEYGISEHAEFIGMDTRSDQKDLNCRVELQK